MPETCYLMINLADRAARWLAVYPYENGDQYTKLCRDTLGCDDALIVPVHGSVPVGTMVVHYNVMTAGGSPAFDLFIKRGTPAGAVAQVRRKLTKQYSVERFTEHWVDRYINEKPPSL